jgi:hypothetical protein
MLDTCKSFDALIYSPPARVFSSGTQKLFNHPSPHSGTLNAGPPLALFTSFRKSIQALGYRSRHNGQILLTVLPCPTDILYLVGVKMVNSNANVVPGAGLERST